MFSQSVLENLGYYVYLLVDSRDGEVFYVGKGKGNRVFNHMDTALETEWESDKLDQIRAIIDEKDQKVIPLILRHGLSEEEAILIESAILDLPDMDHLTNIASGHDSWERGLKSIAEIKHLYDAEEAIIDDQVLIININTLYRRFMSPEEIYQATKASWVLGPRRNKAKYVIASYRGVARAVFEVHSWYEVKGPKRSRWGFEGGFAPEEISEKYNNKSLKKYRKRGAQNPVKYVNC